MAGLHDFFNLYLVRAGIVTLTNSTSAPTDRNEAILVLALDEQHALDIAKAYDHDQTDYDNVVWNGETISVVCEPPEREKR